MAKDQATHDHYANNARYAGHRDQCEKVAGKWTTVQGVGVNWPTIVGRPVCTCGKESNRG